MLLLQIERDTPCSRLVFFKFSQSLPMSTWTVPQAYTDFDSKSLISLSWYKIYQNINLDPY